MSLARNPATAEVSLWMDVPIERVWALVTDITRIGEFSPETFEAEWTRGHTHATAGATFRGHVRRNGVGPVYWAPCRVSICRPREHFEFAVLAGGPVNNWGYRLSARDGGTQVSEYFRLETTTLTRIYWTVLGPLRRRTNRRGMTTTLERMRAVLEREAHPPSDE